MLHFVIPRLKASILTSMEWVMCLSWRPNVAITWEFPVHLKTSDELFSLCQNSTDKIMSMTNIGFRN